MKFLIKRFPIFVVACITAMVFVMSGLIFLNLNIRKNIEQSVYSDLRSSTEQQAYNFISRLNGMEDIVLALSRNMDFNGNLDTVSVDFLNGFVNDTQFDSFVLFDINGRSISNLGKIGNMRNGTLFTKALEGQTVISRLGFSDVSNARVISIAAPIIRQGQTIGVLVGSFKADKLGNWLSSSFDGYGMVYITDANGEIIARAVDKSDIYDHRNNFFVDLGHSKFSDDKNLSIILNNLNNDKAGYAKYENNNEQRLMYYAKMPVYEWNIFSVVLDRVVSDFKDRIIMQIYALSIMIILLSMGFLYWIVKMQVNHVQRIEQTAFVDPLTGGPTVLKFKLDAQKILTDNPNTSFVLSKFDIDRFKLINKTFGYIAGDRIIKNIAKALDGMIVGDKERYARANVDEFIILCENNERITDLQDKFLQNFFELMGKNFNYNIKFPTGYYIVDAGSEREDISSMVEKANIAHRRAKQLGMKLCIYDDEMVREALAKKEIENKMERALHDREFKVFLQPKYELQNECIVGAEALVRWQPTCGDMIYPNNFIPLFEENGFIIKLDTYMFEEVCKLLHSWNNTGLRAVPISVNFSKNQLNNTWFVDTLCAIADKYNISRDLLEIEITESAIIENETAMIKVLAQLHDAGFKLAMDDFGSGYSSLGMLKNIPTDIIKIDRSFFIAQIDNLRAKIVIMNIMKMARDLGIVTVAEGIETKEYVDFLKSIKCDIVQGYYYSKPVPAEEFTVMLSKPCEHM